VFFNVLTRAGIEHLLDILKDYFKFDNVRLTTQLR